MVYKVFGCWYDPCTGEYLGLGHPAWECAPGETPKCCFAGTTKEGWYESSCFSGQPGVPNLIRYAQCEPGEYAIVCNQSSDVFAKFTQELVYNEQRIGTNTSINWLVYYPIKGLTQHNTEELLNSALPLDYIAYWQASQQLQFGSARGDPKKLRGSLGLGKSDIVITGPFNLKQGHPYFIGATMDWDRWTWVGKVPERVRFDFKYGPENSSHENYIVLPLDTTIRTASQLCKIKDTNGNLIINQMERIYVWDASQQKTVFLTIICGAIQPGSEEDVSLEAGNIYLIKVNNICDPFCSWQQT